ncbi:Membrane-bound lytic murein transglycosylase B [Granulibacter bethesdensis]|uniref:Membrane-bound lytic murein transglycosylase B n=2 Tax=Granulibacter bethesdensis TaxID=364410 RepID=A0AAN0RDH3_9PROT|nr:Membrane-bound lytic murein transglycosylase B [Granulibacter bethesdensis]AHJ66546.1 Membrane-bound lytic murein transglycosylase B [Granulibacter bethesdensis CGDNIH4]
MMSIPRRSFLSALPAAACLGAAGMVFPSSRAEAQDFRGFIAGVRAEGRRAGISDTILAQALNNLSPNTRVIELDRKQPEFTMTWERYRSTRLSEKRIAAGREQAARNAQLLMQVENAYGVDRGVILGIWGLETNYGAFQGGFNVIEATATLAWEGRRASFFRAELMAALKILNHGDITMPRMQGSYAGAMGQPQFMPTSFNRYAVDFDGDGRRNIWDSVPDVLASIANYLLKSGWHQGQPWGTQAIAPATIDPSLAGRENRLSLAEWARLGVTLGNGQRLPASPLPASLILPDGPGGEAFLAYPNFNVIRRYNPSDFYAIAVGMIGDMVMA